MPSSKKEKVARPKLPTLISAEKLSQASVGREQCLKCELHSSCSKPFQQPLVPDGYTGKYLFIGDNSESLERTRTPFASLGGKLFKAALQEAGIERNEVAFMPVLRCKPTKTAKMAQIRACAPFVFRLIEVLNPEHVIALGPNAAKSLFNKGTPGKLPRQRGRRQTPATANEKNPFKFYRSSSITQLGTSPNEYARFKEDIARFGRGILEAPKRAVPVCKQGIIGFDTEYTPDTVLCGAVSDGKTAVTVEAKSLSRLSRLLSKNTIVGHNLPVDLDALLKAKTPGLKVAMEQWLQGNKQRDTLLIAKLADENRGVGGYTLESLLLARHNASDYKAATEAIGPDPLQWPIPLRDERCRLDAWATVKVFEALEASAIGPQHISHRIAMTLHRMKHCGVYISMEKFQQLKREVYQEESKAKAVLLKHARRLGMSDFEASKDADVRELVYGKLGLEIESYTKSGLASASVKHLKEYKDDYPEIQALLAYSKADKLKTTYVDGLEKKFVRLKDGRFWIPVQINALAAKTGRRSSAGPNFQNLPVRVRQLIVSRFKNGSIADNDYCLSPATKVLYSDLTWKEASEVRRGDELIGFDEEGTQRKFRAAKVTSSKRLTRPCYSIVTDKGTVTASAEHRWLARTQKEKLKWVCSSQLQLGQTIAFLAKPWEAETTRESGYLAGFLDGEGFVSGSTGFGQNKGEVSDYVQWLLKNRGYSLINHTSKGVSCEQVLIQGSLGEKLRLLGTLRPFRLLPKARRLWEGKQTWGKRSEPATVLSVMYVGEREVVAIGTTTNTLIAEGFLSHNSKLEPIIGGWVTGEQRLTDYFTKYPNGYIKIGADFFKKTVEKNTKEYTMMKSLVLAIIYNKKKWSLAEDLWAQGARLDSDYEKHTEESGVVLDRFLSELFPGVAKYHAQQEAQVLRYGYVDNALGQRRRLPLPPEPERSDKIAYRIYMRFKAHVINQSINYPIQSLASYVTGSALIDLEAALLRQFKYSYVDYHQALMNKEWPNMPLLCCEVHDDIVEDIPKGMEKKTKEVTHDIMQFVPTLRKLLPGFKTPLSIDTNAGNCWGLKS